MVYHSVDVPSRDDVARRIKSCIASSKYGVPAAAIREELELVEGAPLDLPEGCNNIYDIIRDMKQVTMKAHRGVMHFVVRNNPKTAHLTELISKQKSRKDLRSAGRTLGEQARRNNRQKFYNSNRELNSSEDSGKKSSGASSDVRIIKPSRPRTNRRIVQSPLISNGQLIGDDFFLQLAIRQMKQPVWREFEKGPLHSGLCVSGQTIRDCIKALREVDVMSNKLVILLGAEDIYQGRPAAFIQDDYEELLELLNTKFAYAPGAITLCTIPPLGNLSWLNQPEQFTALRAFNYWIVSHSAMHGYRLIDWFSHFSTVRGTPEYELFQVEPRRVSGSAYAYLLLSSEGRKLAMTILRRSIDYGYDHD